MKWITVLLCLINCLSYSQKSTTTKSALPRVIHEKDNFNLMVNGKPFLILGAQLWNSSAWPYITDQFWPQLRALNANTLEAPIYWQSIEPKPGQYNFKELDDLVRHAREEKIKLVLLWFASWKNGTSSYAPAWLLEDPSRYQRMKNGNGDELLILSPVSSDNRD